LASQVKGVRRSRTAGMEIKMKTFFEYIADNKIREQLIKMWRENKEKDEYELYKMPIAVMSIEPSNRFAMPYFYDEVYYKDQIINYYNVLCSVIDENDGLFISELDKKVLVVFGLIDKSDFYKAVNCSIDISNKFKIKENSQYNLGVNIGISIGDAEMFIFGANDNKRVTLIGDAKDYAIVLSNLCSEIKTSVLVDTQVYNLTKDRFQYSQIDDKGIEQIYKLHY